MSKTIVAIVFNPFLFILVTSTKLSYIHRLQNIYHFDDLTSDSEILFGFSSCLLFLFISIPKEIAVDYTGP